MKTLTVMSRKGGAGKTTVAVNLTLAARAAGIRAVLADADSLRSASEVLKGRDDAPGLQDPLHVALVLDRHLALPASARSSRGPASRGELDACRTTRQAGGGASGSSDPASREQWRSQ